MSRNRDMISCCSAVIAAIAVAASICACDSGIEEGEGEGADTGTPAAVDSGKPHGEDTGAQPADAGRDTGGGSDAALSDVGEPDGGGADAGIPDDAAWDTGPEDIGAAPDAGPVDAGNPQLDGGGDAVVFDAGMPDAGSADAGPGDAGSADAGSVPGWRRSLTDCWTDAACKRVMAVAHGGAWDALKAPYLSNAALVNAYNLDIDGVKIDVRVTADNVPVLAHSSPIQIYESVLCSGKKIEEMTAAQVTACSRVPSTTEKFQRLDDVLGYLQGKMVVQLCVKESADYQRTIEEIHALGAEDFTFIELDSAAELQNIIPTLSGADTVWYLVNVADRLGEVDTLLNVIKNPRAFMYEFDPTVDVSTLTPTRLHPAGIRSFTYDSATPLLAAKIQAYFEGGFDVVSTQSAANAVEARKKVNTAHGYFPP